MDLGLITQSASTILAGTLLFYVILPSLNIKSLVYRIRREDYERLMYVISFLTLAILFSVLCLLVDRSNVVGRYLYISSFVLTLVFFGGALVTLALLSVHIGKKLSIVSMYSD